MQSLRQHANGWCVTSCGAMFPEGKSVCDGVACCSTPWQLLFQRGFKPPVCFHIGPGSSSTSGEDGFSFSNRVCIFSKNCFIWQAEGVCPNWPLIPFQFLCCTLCLEALQWRSLRDHNLLLLLALTCSELTWLYQHISPGSIFWMQKQRLIILMSIVCDRHLVSFASSFSEPQAPGHSSKIRAVNINVRTAEETGQRLEERPQFWKVPAQLPRHEPVVLLLLETCVMLKILFPLRE